VSPAARERFNVLVVDDDVALLETTVALLQSEHHVVGTQRPHEALRLLKASDFQVVVTDWMMPSMDGIELFRAILRLDRPIAVLLMTGRMEEFTDEVSFESRKLLGLISKPFAPDVMLERVRQLGRLAAMKASVKKLKEGG
jgi:CheY-like chemotaxis protein